jgi:putative PIN family toxin of toxin-antitoxin system
VRIVLDTNILVSALLRPGSIPDRVVRRALLGEPLPLYDARTIAEHQRVLARAKFQIDPGDAEAVIDGILAVGELVDTTGVTLPVAMPDPKDVAFAEVALAGKADALVTGNRKHFPDGLGVAVLSPRDLFDRLDERAE